MRQRMHVARVALAILAFVTGAASAGDRQEGRRRDFDVPALGSRWRVIVGGNLNSFDTEASLASGVGPLGIVIRLEDDLGLTTETGTFVTGFHYALNDRHALEFQYTDLQRSARRVIREDFEFGDVTFLADGVIDTRFDTRIVRFRWEYDFSDSRRLDAGLSAGLSTFEIGVGLRGAGVIVDDDGPRFEDEAEEGSDFIAPVPVIGFYLDYAFTPRSILRASAESIELSVSQNRGRVVTTEIALEYSVSRLVGLGLGLGHQSIEYGKKTEGKRLQARYQVQSLNAYLSFSF